MSAKKVMTLILCMVLVAALSVAGTLAYLTSKASVTNAFAYGSLGITMDEAKVNMYGEKVDEDGTVNPASTIRVVKNDYRLIPGMKYIKDPVIYVAENSEPSYLYVEVVNQIADIEADNGNTIADQLKANGWELLSGNVYWQSHGAVGNAKEKVKVFEEFTIAGNVKNDKIAEYQGDLVTVTAYAIQAATFTSPSEAWTACMAQYNAANP